MNSPANLAETSVPPPPGLTLRQRAEATLRELPEDFESLSPEATQQMFHELRVHQSELEMQNEELRQTQAALDSARARYFDFYDLAPVGYLTLNERGLIEQANLTTATLLGAARETLIKQSISRFIVKQDQEIFYRYRQQLAETNQQQACDLRLLKANGAPFWARLEAIAVCDDETGAQTLRIVLRDIGESKQAEAELLRSNGELEQFSYSISHDMRQPLRMISSYLQLLQKSLGDTLDAENREYFNFAIDGAQRLDAMLRGLLDYSRVGRQGEPPVWLDSRAVLDDALLFLRPLVAEARAAVRIDGEWPRLLASPDELLRLLQNLIGNALKFRIEGRPPEITLTSEVSDGHWHLSVADNGVGIQPDQIGRLFQVFQRLQSRAAFEGTGIGLALCRKIAEHHGGRIWAESAGEGRGSRFHVELPLPREAAA